MIREKLIICLIIVNMSSMCLYSQIGKDDSYLDAITNNETYLQICSDSNDKIVDLMVMYYGANGRPKYTKEELKSYVFRYNDSGDFEWLFDGFLFLEDRTEVSYVEKGYAFEQSAYLFQKYRARKQEWMWLLDRTFDPNEGLCALNDLISEFSAVEKPPLRKRKVILCLPEPLSGQLDWGQLNNNTMDFANDSDRVNAVKWYVDELISRFNRKDFRNIELSGFYWFRTNDELTFQLMPEIASYIHSKGYKFYWRPSYRRFRGSVWKSYGFDAAYLTPDHLTTSRFKKINVVRACTYASEYNMGLEIDLDKLVKQYQNYRTKFDEYMEVYRDFNVFDKAAMSYQDGDGIFYEMSKSKNAELNTIYNKILNEVAIRQKNADMKCK